MSPTQTYDPKLWEELRNNRTMRVKLARESLYWFFHIYFGDHARFPTAGFQKEIYGLLENPTIEHLIIVAFRGSGKSTIATLAYPIWAILGKQERKFVIIFSQTQPLAKSHLQNIKRSFETNELLRNDFGPVDEMSDEWGSMSLVLPKYNARISAASTDQSIRGSKFGSYRPDTLIADDIEDTTSVLTQESRDRTYSWFTSEIISGGDQHAKIVNIGNLLHQDSLLMRFKARIAAGTLDGVYREFPILDDNGKPLWKGKYPTPESIEAHRRKIADDRTWLREFCLKIVADQGQVILPEWIHTYNQLPPHDEQHQFINTFIGVDPAMREHERADYSAAVIIHAYGYETKDRKYYLDPHFINERLSPLTLINRLEELYKSLRAEDPYVLIEDNLFQRLLVEIIEKNDVIDNIKGLTSVTNKYTRLATAGMLFEQGKVFFPADGSCKPIITELLGFETEKHDDLCDAVSLALNYIHTRVQRTILMSIWDGSGQDNPVYDTAYLD